MEHVHGILLDQKFLCRSVHAAFVNTKCTRCGWSAPSFRTRSSTICGAQWAPGEPCNSHHARHKTHSHLFFHVCVVVLSFVASRSVAAAAASSLMRFSTICRGDGETFVWSHRFTTHFGCVLAIACAFSAKSRHCLCTLQRSRHHIHDEDRRQQQLFQWLVLHDWTASCVRSRSRHIFSASLGTPRADGARQVRLACAKPQTTSEDLGMKAVLLAAKCTYRNSATLKHTRTEIPALPHTCKHSMESFFLRWMKRKISNRQNQRLHQSTSEGRSPSQTSEPAIFPHPVRRLLQPPTPDVDAQHDHLRLWPTNSRNMRPIRRCASHNATPSIRSTLRLGAVGTDGAHEGGIRCQLCATEEGQAIHHPSSLRHPPLTFVMTRPPASRQTLATNTLQSPPSTCQDSCPRAAGTRSQRERKTKSAKEDHPEQLGWDLRESARWACGQCQPNSRPSLGPGQGHPDCVNSCQDVIVPEVRFDTRSCLLLPAILAASGLEIFRFAGCWSNS